MMRRTTGDAARTVGGQLIGGDLAYGAVSSDTRSLDPGALFVGLRGPNFDGADFVPAAAARGAVAALVERRVDSPLAQIIVPDALRALQRLAAAWRANFDIPVVGVAGSNGKTTTKEMTAAILARGGPCVATRGSLNNHIGVPLTLMRLEPQARSAVIEIGANHPGEVAALVELARPTVGLITNAGAEHLEGFGDLDGVAHAEGEMVAGLEPRGTAVLNADDAYAPYWRSVSGTHHIVSFGAGEAAAAGAGGAGVDYTARNVVQGIENGAFVTRFTLASPLGERTIVLQAGGAHNVMNALAAAAAAGSAGASLDQIGAGLEDFRAVSGRLQLKAGPHGSWIIDDTYNANPSSVRAGIDVLVSSPGAAWLVLADMGELGEQAADSHAEVGSYALARGVRRLFAMGPLSARAVDAFGAGAEWFGDVDALVRRLEAELTAGVTLLVKGSRFNRLERVVQALTGAAPGPAAH
jgi:UDP-N-acetylmuramoyl-tripeptide--D-alanyl-D-alanine ligase